MTAPLWTAEAAAAATGGQASGWQSGSGVAIDSRSLVPGDLFVALRDVRDGHDFATAALDAGAGALMLDRRPAGLPANAPVLMVDDTLASLGALGRAGRARSDACVLAVTGSVGKTSTKEMLRVVLAAAGSVHAAEQSFNNHWGVPLTLARMPGATEFAVLEIGMNTPGEIAPLSGMAKPDVAIITTVAPVHAAAFDDVSGIAREKAAIMAGLGPDGTAILPADNAWYAILAEAAGSRPVVTFGPGGDIDLVSADVTATATVIRIRIDGAPATFKLAVPGTHFATNALAVIAAARSVGVDPARAMMTLGTWSPPDGRGTRTSVRLGPDGIDGEILLIDDSFNANPTSVRAAIAVLAASEPVDHVGRVDSGRRIAFLGDMLELGPEERALHAALADLPEMAAIDIVHTCGPLMRALHDALPADKRGTWHADSTGLAEKARRTVDAGDVCMVKGSKGARMGPVVAAIRGLGHTDAADHDGSDRSTKG